MSDLCRRKKITPLTGAWRGGWDSNPRGLSDPTRFRDEHVQPLRHLPISRTIGRAARQLAAALVVLATLGRFERPTSSSAGKRSNPLSYRVRLFLCYYTTNRHLAQLRMYGDILSACPKTLAARKVIQAQATCSTAKSCSMFCSQRMRSCRTRFRQEWVRSTIPRRFPRGLRSRTSDRKDRSGVSAAVNEWGTNKRMRALREPCRVRVSACPKNRILRSAQRLRAEAARLDGAVFGIPPYSDRLLSCLQSDGCAFAIHDGILTILL